MDLHIHLPDDLAARLTAAAGAAGAAPEAFVVGVVRESLDGSASRDGSANPDGAAGDVAGSLDEILAPIREAFAASGMTEEELAELLEEEKHAMRRGE